jgi:7-cyano-7-deazaguanine synthase in queuosine biosynthesis
MQEVIKTVEIDNVSIDIYSGPIAINCSGGADSSSLLYLLMKYKTDDTIHVFTSGSHNKKRFNVKVAVNVIDKCIELTGNSNIQHHLSFCDILQFKTATDIALSDYVDTGRANVLYTGITKNPPKDVTDNFLLPITEHERDPIIGDLSVTARENTVYMPYINIDKRSIQKIYNYENIFHNLFPLTRSCEYDYTSDYFDNIKDPEMGHCGKCWWCEERKWAFGRL